MPSFLRRHIIYIVLFLSGILRSQELPPVINYSPNEYAAGNQNWMISQGDDENFYFANGAGLLEFNGQKWKLYPVPNNSIVRAVRTIDHRIYTGAYMEAGYWTRDEIGELEYTSIISRFPNGVHDGELFWDVQSLEGLVVFRSFAGIYFYNPEENEVFEFDLPENKPISGIFKVEDELFFQLVNGGLYTIQDQSYKPVIPQEKLGDKLIKYLYQEGDALKFVTASSGFFSWKNGELSEFNTKLSQSINYTTIFAATRLMDGTMVLGTVGKGICMVDQNGLKSYDFNQENILLNNTILSLFVDDFGNIWCGLDFGISMIEPNSPFRSFEDIHGEIGSVYTSFSKDGNLYLGTNQGLYLKKKESKEFKLISGTNGQVWKLNEIEGQLFCGHDSGTFLIDEDRATKIADRLGTWFIKKVKKDVYVQGHYYGFSFLKKQGDQFKTFPLVEDFPHSSRYIEIESDSVLWVNNEHKGVFRVKYSDSLNKIKKLKNFRFADSIWATSSMFRFRDSLYYSTKTKVYKYDPQAERFTERNELNKYISQLNRISRKMINDRDQKLWGFADNFIFYLKPSAVSSGFEIKEFFVDQTFRNIADGYENISLIEDDTYLLGIANGYLEFKDSQKNFENHRIKLGVITYNALESNPKKIALDSSPVLKNKENNISFQYHVPVFNKYTQALFSYRLLGLSSKWSEWSSKPEASFENLGFGEYQFEVRGKIANEITDPVHYQFEIERPFYLSKIAIAFYTLAFILFLILIHFIYKWYHKRQATQNERVLRVQNLEAEKKIIKLQNEKLEQDMANKNRELAVSTMSLIKKNEFLTSIKDQLKENENSTKIRSVIKTIDKDINEEDNWNFFKKAFNNADKDFLQKMKKLHPDLTSSDLKLCAYLRLNLSSKEIAPLLNISVKSVEIKRYRLRKKMNLDRNTNLTDYILQI